MRKPSIECSQVISLVTLRILRSVAARAVFLFVAATVISCGCKQVVRNPASPAPPPIKVAVQYWPGIYWLGIADEKGWFKEADDELAFSFAAGFDSLHGAVRQINDFMIAKGITSEKLDSSHFLDGSFIRALK